MSQRKTFSLFSAALLVSALSGAAMAHELTLRANGEVKEGAPAGATFGVGAAIGAAAVGAWSLLRRK